MKTMRKRVGSILLVCAMLLTLLPTTVLAAETDGQSGTLAGETAAVKTVSTAEALTEAITAAQDGETIQLGADISVTLPSFAEKKALTFDLGTHTLTLTNTDTISVANGAAISFKNGNIVAGEMKPASTGTDSRSVSTFEAQTGSTITLDNVDFTAGSTALTAWGNAAAVNVLNGSTITAVGYCFGTNARSVDNYNVNITMKDSTIQASTASNALGTAMYLNVPGNLMIDNCTIQGYAHGLFVRGGTAVIKNSTITNTLDDTAYANLFLDNWGTGNSVPLAALTLGNDGDAGYLYPTDVTLENTTVTSAGTAADSYRAIYAQGNAGEGQGVTLTCDANCQINGKIVYANEYITTNLASTGAVAKVTNASGTTSFYSSLAEAVEKAESGATVKLLQNVTTPDTLVITKNVTLDLNGKTFTYTGNGSSGSQYAVQVGTGAKDVTVKNGTIEDSTSVYNKLFAGIAVSASDVTMNLTDLKITIHGTPSNNKAFAVNGNQTNVTFNLNRCDFTGGMLGTYFPAATNVLNIEDSTITSNTALAVKGGTVNIRGNSVLTGTEVCDNYNEIKPESSGVWSAGEAIYLEGNYDRDAQINVYGGTFKSTNGYAVRAQFLTGTGDKAINIQGGTFSGAKGIVFDQQAQNTAGYAASAEKDLAAVKISGGTFDKDVSAFVAEGYMVISGPNGNGYQVVEKEATAAEVVVAKPNVTVPQGLPEAEQQAAAAVGEALESASNLVTGGGLTAAANDVANNNKVTTDTKVEGNTTVLEKLQKITSNDSLEAEGVTIVVQPYMDVEITGISTTAKTLTLNITPKYKTVATTDSADIQLGTNAVEIPGASGQLTITQPVNITVPLPSGFTAESTAYIKHVKDNGRTYYYTGTVSGEDSKTVTFVNPKGFSTFVISATNEAKASIGDVGYATLQEAVNDVANGQTIKLLADGTATVSKAVTFTVVADGHNVTINAGSGYRVSESGGTYTVTYVGGSSGNVGGGSSTSTGSYAITVPTVTGGTVSVSPKNASKGSVVTITVTPKTGYQLSGITVTDKNGNSVTLTEQGNGKYTFTMPASAVTIKASFTQTTQQPTMSFADVPESYWAYKEIKWAYDNGYVTGKTSTSFDPTGMITRQQIWMILGRMAGSDPADMAAAKAWAVQNGVSDGSNPGTAVSRQQLVTLLYRYAKLLGYSVTGGVDLSTYPDASSVSSYATEAMAWAVGNKIVNGTTAGTLDPAGNATRAQFAAILSRFVEASAK